MDLETRKRAVDVIAQLVVGGSDKGYFTILDELLDMIGYESLERERDELRAACAEMREALELAEAWAKNDCASCESPFKEDDTCQFPNLCTTRPTLAIIQKALSSDAGKDLLERKRQAESIIKRFAEFDHMLIRKAVCKECGESPCKGDDKVLCVYKDLIADIDAFLKGGGKDA